METPFGEGLEERKRQCNYCGIDQHYLWDKINNRLEHFIAGEHICIKAEDTRTWFANLLQAVGSYELERRIKKLKTYKLYDRKYPYDVATKAMSIEFAYDLSTNEPDPLSVLIDQEAFQERMERLTDTQKKHAELYMEGYKPRDIAAMEGRETSNAVRWQRHNMKERLN